MADGICGLDRQGKVTFANPAAARLLGAPADCSDRQAGARTAARLRICPAATARRIARCAAQHVHALRQLRAKTSSFALTAPPSLPSIVLTPIRGQGRVSGSVLSFRDISQRYALDRLKDEFISTVSHELRTPLTSIRGALGLLTSGILGETNEKATNLLRIAAHQLRSPGPPHQRHSRSGAHPERPRAAGLPHRAAGRHREAGHRRYAAAWPTPPACSSSTTPPRWRLPPTPTACSRSLTNLLSNAVKFSPPEFAGERHAAARRHRRHSLRHRSWTRHSRRQAGNHLRPFPAGGCLRLAAEGRHRSRTGHLPHHRACSTRAASGPSAIPFADRRSASFFPTNPLPWRLRAAAPESEAGTAPWCWPTPTRNRALGSPRNWPATATP